jgi:hypothetical protein
LVRVCPPGEASGRLLTGQVPSAGARVAAVFHTGT